MSHLRGTVARLSSLIGALVLTIVTAAPAFAGSVLGGALGDPLGVAAGTDLSTSVPIVEGGLLALLASGVVGGVYLARRKR